MQILEPQCGHRKARGCCGYWRLAGGEGGPDGAMLAVISTHLLIDLMALGGLQPANPIVFLPPTPFTPSPPPLHPSAFPPARTHTHRRNLFLFFPLGAPSPSSWHPVFSFADVLAVLRFLTALRLQTVAFLCLDPITGIKEREKQNKTKLVYH